MIPMRSPTALCRKLESPNCGREKRASRSLTHHLSFFVSGRDPAAQSIRRSDRPDSSRSAASQTSRRRYTRGESRHRWHHQRHRRRTTQHWLRLPYWDAQYGSPNMKRPATNSSRIPQEIVQGRDILLACMERQADRGTPGLKGVRRTWTVSLPAFRSGAGRGTVR